MACSIIDRAIQVSVLQITVLIMRYMSHIFIVLYTISEEHVCHNITMLQAFGGMGVCQDTPLPRMYALARGNRIMDGPDAVHHRVVSRHELYTSKI